jgi:CheY-like chemotaxis protein
MNLQSTPGEGTIATCDDPFFWYHGATNALLTDTSLPCRAQSSDKEERTTACQQHSHDPSYGTSETNPTRPSIPAATLATKGHILLVEDNPINRKVIALAVQKLGYEVTTVCDGQEALDYLCRASGKSRPNAVLMDCMMPVIDGYEATRRIRQDNRMFDECVRALSIIALTASAIKGDREKCREAGMDAYLTKPTAREELKRTLELWIGLERP